jgi:hypothetical protein
MKRTRLLCALTVLVGTAAADAQNLPEYTCWKSSQPVTVDGRFDEAAWKQAAPVALWDVRYIDDPKPHTRPTEVRLLWDKTHLYILFVATDPDVWSVLTERDADLWNDEVVEVFFDPVGEGMDYVEFEVNPLNTVLDLLVTRSPRRKSFFEWSPELFTATQVGGTANNFEDIDQYWSMEMAMPWKALITDISDVIGGRSLPPQDGDVWRFNFYRYERIRENGKEKTIEYSAWSPTGEINFHMPERFGVVTFKEGPTAVERDSWGSVKADH